MTDETSEKSDFSPGIMRGRGSDTVVEQWVIENGPPIFSLCSSGFSYDFASSDINGTLHFWNIEDAEPVAVTNEPDPEFVSLETVNDDDTESLDGLLLGFISLTAFGVLVVIMIFSKRTDEAENICSLPIAKLIAPLTKEKAESVKGPEIDEPRPRVINIFIKDSIINRSNLMLDEEEETIDEDETEVIKGDYHV